ncbi:MULTISPECIES: hypothetical protein [Rhizobium]|uniref:hypothetical protein n=1 Tax=Rhizobium TaxID=379 RepID=UPI0028A5D974
MLENFERLSDNRALLYASGPLAILSFRSRSLFSSRKQRSSFAASAATLFVCSKISARSRSLSLFLSLLTVTIILEIYLTYGGLAGATSTRWVCWSGSVLTHSFRYFYAATGTKPDVTVCLRCMEPVEKNASSILNSIAIHLFVGATEVTHDAAVDLLGFRFSVQIELKTTESSSQ